MKAKYGAESQFFDLDVSFDGPHPLNWLSAPDTSCCGQRHGRTSCYSSRTVSTLKEHPVENLEVGIAGLGEHGWLMGHVRRGGEQALPRPAGRVLRAGGGASDAQGVDRVLHCGR